jgi:hypothetical protein
MAVAVSISLRRGLPATWRRTMVEYRCLE